MKKPNLPKIVPIPPELMDLFIFLKRCRVVLDFIARFGVVRCLAESALTLSYILSAHEQNVKELYLGRKDIWRAVCGVGKYQNHRAWLVTDLKKAEFRAEWAE